MPLAAQELLKLQLLANILRQDVIRMLIRAGSGHPGGSLGMAEILTALYFKILHHQPNNPQWPERDRLILSHGHICPVLYAALAESGYFPVEELETLRQLSSRLQGHPHRQSLPGLETTSGPLGCGLSQACGMAIASKLDQKSWRTICLMSDGEQNEGNTWEGAMLASAYKLNNLVAVLDRNKIQSDGNTEEIMPLEPLTAKYQAFGWKVTDIDGHNLEQIIEAFEIAYQEAEKPTLIIAHTIPGKGVSFMENQYTWHSKPLTEEEAEKALNELKSQMSPASPSEATLKTGEAGRANLKSTT